MATIILGTAGQMLGGPIGGAIGALIGQQIDGRLLAPKARHGPRLGDLAVQTSSYGSQIPKLFGRMRVGGTVIWATDLVEHRAASGGGKGRPKTIDYIYTCSFAVALSARPITAIGRIWADGKLLRGAAGDLKASGRFRFHAGGEDQAVDPLIAAAEGAGAAPAYRGIAYALFEDLALADFGNRIPSLTFEVEAGPAPTVGAIAEALSGGEVRGGATPALDGYAATGDSVRSAIEALGDIAALSLAEEGGRLVLSALPAGGEILLGEAEAGARGAGAGGATETLRAAATALPGEVSLAYHDPARDFQAGLQRARRGGAGLTADRRALPAALAAERAKGLAEHRLASLWAERAQARLHLPWRRCDLRPGAAVRVETLTGAWRVARWTLEKMVVSLELRGAARRAPGGAPAAAGRPVAEPDAPHGPTALVLVALPSGEEGQAPGRPALVAAAAGAAGWRGADLLASFDGGTRWQPAGRTAAPAVIGTLLTVPGAAPSTLIDARHPFEVELLDDAMWLEGRSDGALADGANAAALGDEILQFGTVEPLGGRRFRLSRLLRGRRGTEWAAAAGHVPGEPFVLLDPATLAPVAVPVGALEGQARLLAAGIGDPAEGTAAIRAGGGGADAPPSPAQLRAARRANGDIAISWVRRSRLGWTWADGADAPLGEEKEAYRLRLSGAGFERTAETTVPAYTYAASDQEADGAAGALSIEVVQLGTWAASRPARRTFA